MHESLAPRPLRVLFVITSMPVGGAETLLVNLVRNFDRRVCEPELVCLKQPDVLGEELAQHIHVASGFIHNKFDARVLSRLVRHMRKRKIDAVVTVGAGDKMFWGRLAARIAGVPVICSALHSTGWPDGVGKLNRCLTSITDAFIAVAKPHGEFMAKFERFPVDKIEVIPNGIDVERFQPDPTARPSVRDELGVPMHTRLIGILAALRPEKNHALFVRAAAVCAAAYPDVDFVIIGDGPERSGIEKQIQATHFANRFHLLGSRSDTERLLAALDIFTLTSHNEANPVSILEALACGVPTVATDVGSVSENVRPDTTGFLIQPGNAEELMTRWSQLLNDPALAQRLGSFGRAWVERTGSLNSMVGGYQRLITKLWQRKQHEPQKSWLARTRMSLKTLANFRLYGTRSNP